MLAFHLGLGLLHLGAFKCSSLRGPGQLVTFMLDLLALACQFAQACFELVHLEGSAAQFRSLHLAVEGDGRRCRCGRAGCRHRIDHRRRARGLDASLGFRQPGAQLREFRISADCCFLRGGTLTPGFFYARNGQIACASRLHLGQYGGLQLLGIRLLQVDRLGALDLHPLQKLGRLALEFNRQLLARVVGRGSGWRR